MTSDIVFTLALLILLILHEIIVERVRREAREERQILLDRIQASNLSEFKAFGSVVAPKPKREEKEDITQI